MNTRKWKINGRFRVPVWAGWMWPLVPQPRWLRRWYYRKSFQWWGHPSNHHWKGSLITDDKVKPLVPGERDLWSGGYMTWAEELQA